MRKVLVIRCDGGSPREFITSGDRPAHVMFNSDGVPGYLLDEDAAGELCAGNPDRYKLYKSAPVAVRVRGKWVTLNPWVSRKVQKDTGKTSDNGEVIFEEALEWREDRAGISVVKEPSEAVFLGTSVEKDAGGSFDQQVAIKQALAKAEKALTLVAELTARVEALESAATDPSDVDEILGAAPTPEQAPKAVKPKAKK
jgi:hypothetical protein